MPASVSRVMSEIVTPQQTEDAVMFRRLVSIYLENRDLILMGGYSQGQDPDLDVAVQLWPKLMSHIQQPYDEKSLLDDQLRAFKVYLVKW